MKGIKIKSGSFGYIQNLPNFENEQLCLYFTDVQCTFLIDKPWKCTKIIFYRLKLLHYSSLTQVS
jgi:hypothetical protein